MQVAVEIRHDNVIYKCYSCETEKRYESAEKVYSVSFIEACLPSPTGMQVMMKGVIICPDCWKAGVKAGKFKEPSGIVIPEPKLPNGIFKK